MTAKQTTDSLVAMGWRDGSIQSIRDFQRGWNLGPRLVPDGIDGPKTRAALALSMQRRREGRPDFSEHFSASEFRCPCGGENKGCRRIWIMREVVQAAEELRKILGPFTPRTGCRCTLANARVAGAINSQHLWGAALDLGTNQGVYDVTEAQIRKLGQFSGIGYYKVNGRRVVRHVDMRHLEKRVAGTVSAPALWEYGNFGSRHLIKPRPDLAAPQKAAPSAPAAPAPVTQAPATQEEEYMARISPEDWRVMTTGPDYAFFKNRLAEDPETAPRQPLGKSIEDATDAALAALRAVERVEAKVAAISGGAGIDPEKVHDVIREEVRRALTSLEGKVTFDAKEAA